MRILVVGAGGVGGYFGGLLAQAGHSVAFLARGAHRQAIERQGLIVHSLHGDFTLHPARVAELPDDLGPQDAVVVAVKHYDLAQAARRLAASQCNDLDAVVVPSRAMHDTLNGISGIRMQCAPPAIPACSAIHPASRPITSTTITRPCDVAVVNSRSMHSAAKSTAVSKPKVAVVLSRSLSIVFGTPITRSPC